MAIVSSASRPGALPILQWLDADEPRRGEYKARCIEQKDVIGRRSSPNIASK
jgi:hypothetical protein